MALHYFKAAAWSCLLAPSAGCDSHYTNALQGVDMKPQVSLGEQKHNPRLNIRAKIVYCYITSLVSKLNISSSNDSAVNQTCYEAEK